MADKNDPKYQAFIELAFTAAGLPEVEQSQLETGTYTNAQIAEKMVDDPAQLMLFLMGIRKVESLAEKRSLLSLAVDGALSEKGASS